MPERLNNPVARRAPFGCALALAIVIASGAPSAAQEAPAPARVTVLDPLFATLETGNPVGTNLACRTVSSVIASGANELSADLSPSVSQFLAVLNDSCQQFIAANASFIASGHDSIGPLAALNPVVNPMIDLLSTSLSDTGRGMGTLLFGHSVVQAGDALAYFSTT